MMRAPEAYRRQLPKNHPLYTDSRAGNNGVFQIGKLRVIASDGSGWEHVSVSLEKRCPTWDEMCKVKRAFWEPEDCVVQYHPPESTYVNCHPYCLHLWRPKEGSFRAPPSYMVGAKSS